MSTLNVSLLQFDIAWKDKSTNFNKIETMAKSIERTDLILLPEMFQTGFSVEYPEQAEKMDGESISFMTRLAKKHRCMVGGSIMVNLHGQLVNRFIVSDGSDVIGIYDKQHLFKLSEENKHFTAGNSEVDIVIKGFKCRLIVCYDLRFPYLSFNDTDYDILLVVANWPVKRIKHWDRLLQARAIENQAYVVGVNRVGVDPDGHQYPGHSSVYGPDGKRLLRFLGEEVQTLTLDKEQIDYQRSKLPFIKDRRV
ncbi:MAG: nitrilase family protein [Bacteroidia bacterium]